MTHLRYASAHDRGWHLHKGVLREKTDTKEGKDISAKRLHAAAHASPRRAQQELDERTRPSSPKP